MRLNEMRFAEGTPIDGYGPGFFRIGGTLHHGPVLVRPGAVGPWAGPQDAAALVALAGTVDVIFLGLGAEIARAPAPLQAALVDAGIGLETMSTPAAARTYNVLLSEGRRIAAALVPVAA